MVGSFITCDNTAGQGRIDTWPISLNSFTKRVLQVAPSRCQSTFISGTGYCYRAIKSDVRFSVPQ